VFADRPACVLHHIQTPSKAPGDRRRNDAGALPLLRPSDGASKPLSAAAYWIATSGGRIKVTLNDIEAWRAAFRRLIDRIASGEVEAIGLRARERDPLAAHPVAATIPNRLRDAPNAKFDRRRH